MTVIHSFLRNDYNIITIDLTLTPRPMKKFLLFLFVLGQLSMSGQYSAFGNVIAESGTSRGYAITSDPSGNMYVAGTFSNTMDVDPGTAEVLITPSGDMSGMLLKYAPNGDFIWAVPLGGTGVPIQWADEVILDSEFNIYVAGFFAGTCDFDPSAEVVSLYASDSDGYLAKYSPEGNLIWVREVSGPDFERCHGLALNSQGDLIVSGFLTPGTVVGEPPLQLDPTADGGYVCSFDPDGNVNWVKVFQAPSACNALKVATDANDNIYGIGIFANSVDLDPGPGEYMLEAIGGDDAFFYKLNSSGDFQWGGRLGSALEDWGYNIAATANGDAFLTGHFRGDATIGPGNGSEETTILAAGNSDSFCCKLNTEGEIVWIHQLGFEGTNTRAIAVDTDSEGTSYFTGWYNGNISLDNSADLLFTAENGSSEMFILKFNAQGEILYADAMVGSGSQEGRDIDVQADNTIYITGISSGGVDLDPGIGEIPDSSSGNCAFFLRLVPQLPNSILPIEDEHSIFPNPLRNSSNLIAPADGNLIVRDNSGRLVQQYNSISGGQGIDIHLNPGLYHFEFIGKEKRMKQKILIVRE